MFCIPLIGPNLEDFHIQSLEASKKGNLIEFCLDRLCEIDIPNLQKLRKKIQIPIIFTLRKQDQGGHWKKSEQERLEKIQQLALLEPDYFDFDYDTSKEFIKNFAFRFPKIKIIISYHNFSETPEDLISILHQLQSVPADTYKIACKANSTLDALRMLDFIRQNPSLLGLCMGEKGEITRILGPMMGAPWTFACLSDKLKSAEGQISCSDLQNIYDLPRLNEKSAIFGLIGGCIKQSIGHYTHNKVMRELKIDAVYIKMSIEKEELKNFFYWSKKLGFRGLSVTMPLKESVVPFLDHIEYKAQKIGAVNTILFHEGISFGFNKDGEGALDAVEERIKVVGKKILVIGAGGAAKSIIYEAIERGGDLCVLNRTSEKAMKLAKDLRIRGSGLEDIAQETYDILINTTPEPMPISLKDLSSHTFVMDIKTKPKMNLMLEEAQLKGCSLIFGYEMFINQALGQYRVWFCSQIDLKLVKKIFTEEVLKHI